MLLLFFRAAEETPVSPYPPQHRTHGHDYRSSRSIYSRGG